MWLPKEQKVRANKWREFQHLQWNGKTEKRYIREIIYGKRRARQYWEITTDKETLPEESTWFVMTMISNIKYKDVGKIYGVRTLVEYGFKQSKSELGWADFRVTHYPQIEKWWEVVGTGHVSLSLSFFT